METANKTKKRNNVLLKGCFVLLVALVLQIPILMVKGLLNDRKELSREVKSELVTSWGGSVEVTAPKLQVPITKVVDKKTEKLSREIVSSEVSIEANVNSQIRRRSIYDIPVYSSEMIVKPFSVSFKLPRLNPG